MRKRRSTVGADGVVFGVLESDGKIDVKRTKRMRQLIGKRQAVFHRAFDVTPDPFKALEQLVDIGDHAGSYQRAKGYGAGREWN